MAFVHANLPAQELPHLLQRRRRLGVWQREAGGWEARVWAPEAERVALVADPLQAASSHPLAAEEDGYFWASDLPLADGTLYGFSLNGGPWRPDPASRRQPQGVFGPSAAQSTGHDWRDSTYAGPSPASAVLYELHIGTFTSEGTLDAACCRLPYLAELGVTVIGLLPVGAFPGARNWGYDGVFTFAVQECYGGLHALQRFVDAAHRLRIAVLLDLVFNHVGPEGNVLGEYGPYFNASYVTPWGPAVNVDGPASDGVRHYFIENALYFVEEARVDGFRFDAVPEVHDRSAYPFWSEVTETLRTRAAQLDRRLLLIAESDRNDTRYTQPVHQGGLGFDAVWSDDFHHAAHRLLTGETSGFFADYDPPLTHIGRAVAAGLSIAGSVSPYRQRRQGRPVASSTGHDQEAGALRAGLASYQGVLCLQNHDQTGNRCYGERLHTLCDEQAHYALTALLYLTKQIPMLFMGEEFDARSPFLYFTDHSGAELAQAVREGRAREFAGFAWKGTSPDPQAEQSFLESKLSWDDLKLARGSGKLFFVRALLDLRRRAPKLTRAYVCEESARLVAVSDPREGPAPYQIIAYVNLGNAPQSLAEGPWLDAGTSPSDFAPILTTWQRPYADQVAADFVGADLTRALPAGGAAIFERIVPGKPSYALR